MTEPATISLDIPHDPTERERIRTVLIPQGQGSMLVPQQSETAALLSMIERVARDPGSDLDKLQRLLDVRDRLIADEQRKAFGAAMAATASEMRSVATDSANPQTRSRYASYHALDKVIRPVYSAHGLWPTFDTAEGAPENCVRVICDLGHIGGHVHRYHVDMPADGKGAKGGEVMTRTHAMGSALTYAKRYLLLQIFALAIGEPDDDGDAAGTKAGLDSDQLDYAWAAARKLYPSTEADPLGEASKKWIKRLAEAMGFATLLEVPADRFEEMKTKIAEQEKALAQKRAQS